MEYLSGKGAQFNPRNPFLKQEYVSQHPEGIDEPLLEKKPTTQLFFENPRKIVNRVDSPDLSLGYSINPYQGCEHGCIYCYARNTHQYWGLSAGLDFESKIIVKNDAPKLLEKYFLKPGYVPTPIMVSGNTDCYQPVEKELQITRKLMMVFRDFRNPLGVITKNSLVLRDLDIFKELAAENLVHIFVSITTLDEELKRKMEPRTASAYKRLRVVEQLANAGVPTGVMTAPIIPGLNDHEIPELVRQSSEAGASTVAYTVVRLNGSIGEIFKDWLVKTFPDRAHKVWQGICSLHGGKVNDTEWGRRMRGEGHIADAISQLFMASKRKHFGNRSLPDYDCSRFRRNKNLTLF